MDEAVVGRSNEDPSLLEWITPVLRRWKLVAALTLGAGLMAAVASYIAPAIYTATTAFVPAAAEEARLPGTLAGLATQFGLTLDGGGGPSPDFFAQVLTSRELIVQLLESEFPDPAARPTRVMRPLEELLRPQGTSERERRESAIRKLRGAISVRFERRSQIISVRVKSYDPQLAADEANRMVSLLNDFNLRRRQSRSGEQRRFAGQRLGEAQEELRQAEAEHLQFILANRRYSESPALQFQENKLQREVLLRQEIVTTLAREYEQARIAEVRDTPVLTIVEEATPPYWRTSPRRKRMVAMAMFLGAVTAIAAVYLRAYRDLVARQRPAAYGEFQSAWRGVFRDLAGTIVPGRRG
jgi:uncharacterized protein involved in exopolysaccharide biosynthesis